MDRVVAVAGLVAGVAGTWAVLAGVAGTGPGATTAIAVPAPVAVGIVVAALVVFGVVVGRAVRGAPGPLTVRTASARRGGMLAAMEQPSVLPSPSAPSTPGEMVRRARTVSGVPWRRLFGYLRPHAVPVRDRDRRASCWAPGSRSSSRS